MNEKNNIKLTTKELQEDMGLNWYDFGARMYDMQTGKWLQHDAHSEKYGYVSPHTYCINRPTDVIDDDGNDIIVLNASKNVDILGTGHPQGHAAVLIGNDKTGWYLYSKDGGQSTGGKASKSETVDPKSAYGIYFANRKAFATSQRNLHEHYTRAYRLQSNVEQDQEMMKAALNAVKSNYNVLTANCIDVVSDALKAGGMNPGYETRVTQFVATFLRIPFGPKFVDDHYLNPAPNGRYDRLWLIIPGVQMPVVSWIHQ